MAKPTGGDWGIIDLLLVGAAHNTYAAGQQREMICAAYRRHAKSHPLLVAGVTAWFLAHLWEVLPRWADPLYLLGVGAERGAELARRMRAR